MIRKLEWDSTFFGIEIGMYESGEINDANLYDLIITKSPIPDAISLQGYEMTMQEERRIYEKELFDSSSTKSEIQPFSSSGLKVEDLYRLAFEAGKYSRFRLDPYFDENDFYRLYRCWVEASVKGTFADAVFVLMQKTAPLGFVTTQIKENIGHIGLIASDPLHQFQGIGSTLLAYAEKWAMVVGVQRMKIPTQAMNRRACSFYEKKGYILVEQSYISHYWRGRNI